MHRNRQEAFQGMTKQEMEEAEKCVQHFREEHMGMKPHMRRNAFTNEKTSPFLAKIAENDENEAWFDDVHNYGPI